MRAGFIGTMILAGLCQTASASFVLVTPVSVSGTGLGTVATILTIQDTSSEIGCVGATSSQTGSTFTGGLCTGSSADVKTGASQIGPQPLTAAGVTSASNFAIVFNADQPSGGPITLTGLTASFYNSTGTLLYQTAGFSCPGLASAPNCTFPQTFSGIGQSGFVFGLDSAQSAAATAAGVFNSANGTRVGLSASLTGSAGGPETFSLGTIPGTTGGGGGGGSPTPEPESLVLALSGGILLLSAKLLARRWRRAHAAA